MFGHPPAPGRRRRSCSPGSAPACSAMTAQSASLRASDPATPRQNLQIESAGFRDVRRKAEQFAGIAGCRRSTAAPRPPYTAPATYCSARRRSARSACPFPRQGRADRGARAFNMRLCQNSRVIRSIPQRIKPAARRKTASEERSAAAGRPRPDRRPTGWRRRRGAPFFRPAGQAISATCAALPGLSTSRRRAAVAAAMTCSSSRDSRAVIRRRCSRNSSTSPFSSSFIAVDDDVEAQLHFVRGYRAAGTEGADALLEPGIFCRRLADQPGDVVA